MVRPAAAILRTRAAATNPITSAPAAPRRKRLIWHWISCATNPSFATRARSSSAIPLAAGAALALAGEDPKAVSAIVVFAPARGGHANDAPNHVCAPHTLITAAAAFGKGARVPVTWLVAANHTYFSPELSRQLADALRSPGGKADFSVLSASGSEGHWMAESEGGVRLAGPELDRALKLRQPVAVKKR
jgi:hypothetical protein